VGICGGFGGGYRPVDVRYAPKAADFFFIKKRKFRLRFLRLADLL